MSKRDVERFFESVRQLADRLSETDATLSPAEVHSALEQAGCNTDALRERLYAAANEIADRQRLKGKPVPLPVRQVIDATAPADRLPRDLMAALERAKQWISTMRSPMVVADDLTVLRAYRKSGELSERDATLLDRLEEELKKRLRAKDEHET